MKVTVNVSPETAKKIQAMPDPAKELEEALQLKEYRDWRKARLTPEVQSILKGAMKDAESLEGKSRTELLEEFDEVTRRISHRACQS